jgi:cell division protease FtsH
MDEEMGLFSMDIFENSHDTQVVSKCRKFMNQLYDETRTLLDDNRSRLEDLTAELLEKEALGQEDITRICA